MPVDRLAIRMELGMARDVGFIVYRDGVQAGAFETVEDMARYIEAAWRQYNPQRTAVSEDMPNVVKMQATERRKGWLGG